MLCIDSIGCYRKVGLYEWSPRLVSFVLGEEEKIRKLLGKCWLLEVVES